MCQTFANAVKLNCNPELTHCLIDMWRSIARENKSGSCQVNIQYNNLVSVCFSVECHPWGGCHVGYKPLGLFHCSWSMWWLFSRDICPPWDNSHSSGGRHCSARVSYWEGLDTKCFSQRSHFPLATRLCSVQDWHLWMGRCGWADILGFSDWEHHTVSGEDHEGCALHQVQVRCNK